jgi:hypothetical protein
MLKSPVPKGRPTPAKPRTALKLGEVNAQSQKLVERLGKSQEGMRGQNVYTLECQRPGCGHRYCDDGIQFAHRRCPRCDGGAAARKAPEAEDRPPMLF